MMLHQEWSEQKIRKLFSSWTLILCAMGLLINLLLSKLVIILGLPLYIDNVGSILVAALGGALPGMTVGFLSNVLGSLTEPISMYYAVLTIIIAWLASVFSRKGWLRKWKGCLAAAGCFVLIGGAVGSVMTWFLYGGGIGGIAEPYARLLYQQGMPEFLAQLTADVLIDIPDKLITVGLAALFLRFCPKKLLGKFPLGYVYDGSESTTKNDDFDFSVKHTVNRRLTFIMGISVVTVSVLSLAVSAYYHQQQMVKECTITGLAVSKQAALCVDGDLVDKQLEFGETAASYAETEEKLYTVLNGTSTIKYIYVYSVKPEGCYVVFDLDIPGEPGLPPGSVVLDDPDINNRMDRFLSGGEVEPGQSDSRSGTLLSAYTPIRNSEGDTVAYACADVDMNKYTDNMLTYIIQVMSILFAIALLAVIFTLWYVNRHITTPIRTIVDQTQALNKLSPENWLSCPAWLEKVPVKTDDELEELYTTVTTVEENASKNVRKLMETEQKLLQTEELERINRELELTIKKADEANQAKTDFLSRMSHDIRTPLNAILGTAELAKDDVNDPEAVMEDLVTISTSGKFLLGLINDILDINKIENGKIQLRSEPYAVTEFINSVEKTIRPLAEKKNIEFIFDMRCGHGLILVDKLRYNQIFFNLLSNAIKYTPAGGKVEFVAEALPAPSGMAGVRNYVRDNGIGMSKEYMAHIYEPFTRDRSAAINMVEGSGLGLAIVKNIVDAMGGKISVNSEPGKGTEFIVDLFVNVPDMKYMPGAEKLSYDDALLIDKHILLAEDNEVNTRIAKRLLEKKGCIVSCAVNGQEAVKRFSESSPGEFDIVLMDIRMPVMDGLKAAEAIRSMGRDDAATVPIIAMTANAYEEDVRQSLSAGMNAHLSKPIEPEKLYTVIASYLSR